MYKKKKSKTIDDLTPVVLLIEMTSTKNTIVTDGICPTLTARMGTGGNQVNAVLIIKHEETDNADRKSLR